LVELPNDQVVAHNADETVALVAAIVDLLRDTPALAGLFCDEVSLVGTDHDQPQQPSRARFVLVDVLLPFAVGSSAFAGRARTTLVYCFDLPLTSTHADLLHSDARVPFAGEVRRCGVFARCCA
jgi:hypothetical protein